MKKYEFIGGNIVRATESRTTHKKVCNIVKDS